MARYGTGTGTRTRFPGSGTVLAPVPRTWGQAGAARYLVALTRPYEPRMGERAVCDGITAQARYCTSGCVQPPETIWYQPGHLGAALCKNQLRYCTYRVHSDRSTEISPPGQGIKYKNTGRFQPGLSLVSRKKPPRCRSTGLHALGGWR